MVVTDPLLMLCTLGWGIGPGIRGFQGPFVCRSPHSAASHIIKTVIVLYFWLFSIIAPPLWIDFGLQPLNIVVAPRFQKRLPAPVPWGIFGFNFSLFPLNTIVIIP